MKIQIIFYSMYGHMYKMAQAVAEGAREVKGSELDRRSLGPAMAANVGQRHQAALAMSEIAVARAFIKNRNNTMATTTAASNKTRSTL